MTLTKTGCLGAALLLALFTARGAVADPCPGKAPPYPFQSPRFVDPDPWPGVYNANPPQRQESVITGISADGFQIAYLGNTLVLCDQHYHVPVENPQGPADERVVLAGTQPQPGQWIEVHTVYAARDSTACRARLGLDNDLVCCGEAGPPIVVRGFSARVTTGPGNVQGGGTRNIPLTPPVGAPLAEWSGSNTGPDKPLEPCKPIAAQWSFQLNRDLTVGTVQLDAFPKDHGARGVQTESRLSKDLAWVAAMRPVRMGACAWEPPQPATPPIRTQAEARARCACGAPRAWNGTWYTTASSWCQCCVAAR